MHYLKAFTIDTETDEIRVQSSAWHFSSLCQANVLSSVFSALEKPPPIHRKSHAINRNSSITSQIAVQGSRSKCRTIIFVRGRRKICDAAQGAYPTKKSPLKHPEPLRIDFERADEIEDKE